MWVFILSYIIVKTVNCQKSIIKTNKEHIKTNLMTSVLLYDKHKLEIL